MTAYHQDRFAAPVTGLKLWTSTDDGEHWQRAVVEPNGRGSHGERTFRVITAYPRIGQTTRAVSIKVVARDADGNTIKQTIIRAFDLEPRHHGS